jgi:NTE family protein
MMSRTHILFSFIVLLFCAQSFAQKGTIILKPEYVIRKLPFGLERRRPAQMPTVGLALSGGGARSISHIGVLKAFSEYNIPVDLIVGTSMGSIVGGLYASGYNLSDLDSIVNVTNWNSMLSTSSKIDRRELFLDQKVTEDKSVFALRVNKLKPIIPTSFNDGQKFTNYLNVLTFQAPFRQSKNFDDLEIPFRAVCTNLVNGDPVILKSGSLAQALRASSSVSFLLSPVRIDSLLLVDGGLVANIPVKIARREGADFVIAVNTTSSLHPAEEMQYPLAVADQVLSIPMKQLNEEQLKYADFCITPDLKEKMSTDFSGLDTLIRIGYDAALPYCKSLTAKIDSVYQAQLQKNSFVIRHPRVAIVPGELRDSLNKLCTGDSVRSSDILNWIYQVNRHDDYEEIFARIVPDGNQTNIEISTKPRRRITDVHVVGAEKISEDSIRLVAEKLIGERFSADKVLAASKQILDLYRHKGYSLAEIDSLKFDPATGKIEIHLNEGLISRVTVRGNRNTDIGIIRREMPIYEGDVFVSTKLQQGLSNLRNTNLFESLIVSIERIPDGNIMVLDVEEKNSSIARFGFKLASENTPQVYVDIRNENILSSGSELGFMMFMGQRGRSFTLEHKANRMFNTYFTYNIKAFYRFDDVFTYTDKASTSTKYYEREENGLYRQIEYGSSVALGYQARKLGTLIFRGTLEYDRIKYIHKNLDTTNNMEGLNRIVNLSAALRIDTQDKYPYPTKGLKLNAYYEVASTAFGSKIGYTNIGGDYQFNFTLSGRHTVGTSLKIGVADNTLPITQQYSLGGQYSFFGMHENEFRGRQIFTGSLDYRYFLPVKIFFDTYFQLRYDIGSAWAVPDQIRFADLRHGVGATLSFDTPIGPADFSVGRSFLFVRDLPNNPIKLGPAVFYFSIGYYY